jgi:uncharacterized protein with FMN-binding domain
VKGKEKSKMIGWVIALVVVAGLATAGGVGWSRLMKEHQEARSLPLNAVDFSRLNDGTYHGTYEGGMYKWRANECDVTVANGKVAGIQLVGSKDPGSKNTQHEVLYDRVVQVQSLQVDTISGATLTSKAWLQAVENALLQAQRA